jgi:cation diffusion facilitator family transporter
MSSEDLKKGGLIAKKAFFIVLAVGVTEFAAALFSNSIALLADGIHSIATSLIFLIVFIGLRLSGRAPDGTFRFGYYRIETLGSLIAAFVLTVFGGSILLEAYAAWIAETVIVHAETAIIVASAAAIVVLLVSAYIDRAARKTGSTALRTGRLVGILDALASVAVVIGVSLSKYVGVLHADSIAGILIAGAIFASTYSIFKESSLVLVDACNCGDFVGAIGEIAKSIKGVKEVHSIRVRKLGQYLTGDMHIVVSSEMIVREADRIATEVEDKIKQTFDNTLEFKIRIESDEAHNKHSQELTVSKV